MSEARKTNRELFQELRTKIDYIGQCRSRMVTMPGTPRAYVERIQDVHQSILARSNEISQKWNKITNDDPDGFGVFNEYVEFIDAAFDKATAVWNERQESISLKERAAEVIKADRDEFVSARDYHRAQSGRILLFMFLFAVAAVMIVGAMFWYSSPLEQTVSLVNGVETGKTSDAVWIVALVLALGGRFSVLVLIGWVFSYLRSLYKSHSEQAVTYEDRLAGLNAAEVMLQQGDLESNKAILHQMTRTYLALELNAFRAPVSEQVKGYTANDLTKIADAVHKFIPGGASATPPTKPGEAAK